MNNESTALAANPGTRMPEAGRTRARKPAFPLVRTIAAWGIALLLFFPLFWLGITAFKTEGQAIAATRPIHVASGDGPKSFGFSAVLANLNEDSSAALPGPAAVVVV